MTQWEKITSKDIRNIIAVIIVLGVFILVYLFMVKEIPAPNKELVLMIGGGIIGVLKDITSYFFGASKNEADIRKKNNGGTE